MIAVYTFDAGFIYAGTFYLDPMGPMPGKSTLAAPPRTAGTEVARWLGHAWEVLPMRPEVQPAVPIKVTRSQARRALLLRGLFDQVQPAIDAIPDITERRLAQIEWVDAQDFERHNPLVVMIGQALGLDDAGLDDLFIFAASLP